MTSFKHLIGFLAISLIAAACSQPERITVDEDPEAVATGDTTGDAQSQASFQQLHIGELNPIRSLDPLFAENAASLRAVQLIYEGLVQFDEEGEISPGLAHNWSVSEDSLSYEFYLRPETYYHNSQVFSTGTGRRVTPEDVEFIFERMASSNVPPQAAQLFMNIEGFDPYFQEQRHVYNPQNRQINDITGIETPNDSTVTFRLKNPDPEFPQKMATPFAVIYPQEAVTGSSSITPVGAGPFAFTQVTSDSTLVLSKFQEYYLADQVALNRIDIHVDNSEMSLAQSMETQGLHVIPQLGPQLLVNMLGENRQLTDEYAEQFNLQSPGGSTQYNVRYNPKADLSESAARRLSQYMNADTSSYFNQFSGSVIQPDTSIAQSDTSVSAVSPSGDAQLRQQEIYTSYSDDPFIQSFLGSLSNGLSRQNISLHMMEVRAPTQETAFIFTTDYPLLPKSQWSNYSRLFSFSVDQIALQQSNIEGLSFNQYPWWFDLRDVSLSSTATN